MEDDDEAACEQRHVHAILAIVALVLGLGIALRRDDFDGEAVAILAAAFSVAGAVIWRSPARLPGARVAKR